MDYLRIWIHSKRTVVSDFPGRYAHIDRIKCGRATDFLENNYDYGNNDDDNNN